MGKMNTLLKQIKREHSLTAQQIADILSNEDWMISVHTVRAWLASPNALYYRNMPGPMLELLRLKLMK